MNYRSSCALVAALIATPAAGSAATVVITGQIASYRVDQTTTTMDENGDYHYRSVVTKHTHGGYVGATYTITFDAEGERIDSIAITSPEPQFYIGGWSDWYDHYLVANAAEGGSGGYDSQYLGVNAHGAGSFTTDTGYADSSGVGNDTRLTLVLVPLGTIPVPEPATWALMLLGFAGVGGMIRRRPRPTVT